nr:ankyrin repeat-containing protein [Tanacetum cinerariifolium]
MDDRRKFLSQESVSMSLTEESMRMLLTEESAIRKTISCTWPEDWHLLLYSVVLQEVEKLLESTHHADVNVDYETPKMVFSRENASLVKEGKKWMKTTAESCALIITIVFAAAITVPGGSNQETGIPLFKRKFAFNIFAVADAISLFSASTSLLVFLSILTTRFAKKDFLIKKFFSITFVGIFVLESRRNLAEYEKVQKQLLQLFVSRTCHCITCPSSCTISNISAALSPRFVASSPIRYVVLHILEGFSISSWVSYSSFDKFYKESLMEAVRLDVYEVLELSSDVMDVKNEDGHNIIQLAVINRGLTCFPIAAIVTLQLPLMIDLYQATYIPIFGIQENEEIAKEEENEKKVKEEEKSSKRLMGITIQQGKDGTQHVVCHSIGEIYEEEIETTATITEHNENAKLMVKLPNLFQKGHWSKAKSIFKKHKDAATEVIGDNGDTMLHLAVREGKNNFVEMLLNFKDDDIEIEKQNSNGQTALHIAAIVGNKFAAELLDGNNIIRMIYTPYRTFADLAWKLDNMYDNYAIPTYEVLMAITRNFPTEISFWEALIYPCILYPIYQLIHLLIVLVLIFPFFMLYSIMWKVLAFVEPIKHIEKKRKEYEAAKILLYNLIKNMDFSRTYYYEVKRDSSYSNLLHLTGKLAPSYVLSRTTGAALQLQRELQFLKADNETPEMVFTREHANLVKEGEQWMKTTAESCSITAALIVTIVFAAAITVPGGNSQDTGLPLFKNEVAFNIFAITTTFKMVVAESKLQLRPLCIFQLQSCSSSEKMNVSVFTSSMPEVEDNGEPKSEIVDQEDKSAMAAMICHAKIRIIST